MKKYTAFILTLLLCVCLFSFGCEKEQPAEASGASDASSAPVSGDSLPLADIPASPDGEYAVMEFEGYGRILIEFYPEEAPITVANFKKLVSEGFYDGIIIHRVVPGFVIQGGDPSGTGYYGSDEKIKGEFAANGVENNVDHLRGVLSMARASGDMNSASSQFFIVLADRAAYSLNGQYAGFGKVLSGMDTVDKIAAVPCNSNDKPVRDVVIAKAILCERAAAAAAFPEAGL